MRTAAADFELLIIPWACFGSSESAWHFIRERAQVRKHSRQSQVMAQRIPEQFRTGIGREQGYEDHAPETEAGDVV